MTSALSITESLTGRTRIREGLFFPYIEVQVIIDSWDTNTGVDAPTRKVWRRMKNDDVPKYYAMLDEQQEMSAVEHKKSLLDGAP